MTPLAFLHSKIRIPADTNPVEFQALNPKLGCSILQVEAGSRGFLIVQKPMNGVDAAGLLERGNGRQ